MSKVYTSAVVIIPPEKLWAPIQAIREKYDRNFHRWMPHITLLYPFRPENEFNSLESDFKEVCENLKSFKVNLDNFNYFHHKKQQYTLWLEPTPQKLINDLQKEIQSVTPDCNDVGLFKGGFNPHLSVGQITGKELLDKTLQNLEHHWKSLQIIVDKIFIIAREQRKNSTFQVKKIIQLLK
jgi:2'-5' RNA ligase